MPGYGLPTRIAPRWYVSHLTFRHGNPQLRTESLVGSGIIYPVQFGGTAQPVVVGYQTRTHSVVGGGDIVASEFTGLNLLPKPSRRNNAGAM